MTLHSHCFKTYKLCSSNRNIIVANGISVTIADVGDVFIFQTLKRKDVLHIPKLSNSLLSYQAYPWHPLLCYFLLACCVFQDQNLRPTIEFAKELNSLYYQLLERTSCRTLFHILVPRVKMWFGYITSSWVIPPLEPWKLCF